MWESDDGFARLASANVRDVTLSEVEGWHRPNFQRTEGPRSPSVERILRILQKGL